MYLFPLSEDRLDGCHPWRLVGECFPAVPAWAGTFPAVRCFLEICVSARRGASTSILCLACEAQIPLPARAPTVRSFPFLDSPRLARLPQFPFTAFGRLELEAGAGML